MSNETINSIMTNTEGAYSRDRYGERRWLAVVKFLLTKYNQEQAECILASKIMRVIADGVEGARGSIPVKKVIASLKQEATWIADMLIEENLMTKDGKPVELWSPLAPRLTACWYTRDCFRDEITGTVVQGFDGKFYPMLDGKTINRQPVEVRYLSFNKGLTTVYLCDSAGNKYDIPRVDAR